MSFLIVSGFLAGMKRIASAIDLLLPRTCIVCGQRLLSSEQHICLLCAAEMPLTHFWKQSRNPMSDRFNDIMQKELINGKTDLPMSYQEMPEAADVCPAPCREAYAYASALFTYHAEAPFRLIPYNIKYKGNIRAGIYFGRMLGARLMLEEHWKDADIIIPVPLHWTRRFRRGYNQAEAIAYGIASAMGIPVRNDILFRRKRTRTQTKLNIEGKRRNVSGAFKARKCEPGKYRHIIIVDDVFTTGSTLMACFTALRTVFPPSVRISVATLGFVGGP